MTIKINVPPLIEAAEHDYNAFAINTIYAARDQQWIAMVEPLVNVMQEVLKADDDAIDALNQLGSEVDPCISFLTEKVRAALSKITKEQA